MLFFALSTSAMGSTLFGQDFKPTTVLAFTQPKRHPADLQLVLADQPLSCDAAMAGAESDALVTWKKSATRVSMAVPNARKGAVGARINAEGPKGSSKLQGTARMTKLGGSKGLIELDLKGSSDDAASVSGKFKVKICGGFKPAVVGALSMKPQKVELQAYYPASVELDLPEGWTPRSGGWQSPDGTATLILQTREIQPIETWQESLQGEFDRMAKISKQGKMTKIEAKDEHIVAQSLYAHDQLRLTSFMVVHQKADWAHSLRCELKISKTVAPVDDIQVLYPSESDKELVKAIETACLGAKLH